MTHDKPFKIGDIVKCGSNQYFIIDISDAPYIIFDDGSAHYVLTLRLIGGDWQDLVCVNEAQITYDKEDKDATTD